MSCLFNFQLYFLPLILISNIYLYICYNVFYCHCAQNMIRELSVFLFQPEDDLMCFAASWALGGTDEENHEDDCWRGLINHRFPHHVWRLPV